VAASTQRQALNALVFLYKDELKTHLLHVKKRHEADSDAGYGDVYLPESLARKYPNASREYRWQYVFPAKKLSSEALALSSEIIGFWMPDQVRHDDSRIFCESIKLQS